MSYVLSEATGKCRTRKMAAEEWVCISSLVTMRIFRQLRIYYSELLIVLRALNCMLQKFRIDGLTKQTESFDWKKNAHYRCIALLRANVLRIAELNWPVDMDSGDTEVSIPDENSTWKQQFNSFYFSFISHKSWQLHCIVVSTILNCSNVHSSELYYITRCEILLF